MSAVFLYMVILAYDRALKYRGVGHVEVTSFPSARANVQRMGEVLLLVDTVRSFFEVVHARN